MSNGVNKNEAVQENPTTPTTSDVLEVSLTEAGLNAGVKFETPVQNATIVESTYRDAKDRTVVQTGTEVRVVGYDYVNTSVGSIDANGNMITTEIEESIPIYREVAVYLEQFGKGLTLDNLHDVYARNGNSADAAYSYLKNYIMENKNDPEALQNTGSLLLNNMGKMYDQTKQHRPVGVTQVDVLGQILSTPKGEEVEALICGTIHDFLAQTLEECGINAVLLTGGQMPDGEPHATLLYQRPDGKYVFNNYGKNIVIEAANIKDAAREVFKSSGTLESSGTIGFQNKDRSSYNEFAFRQEAVFGTEMDKRDYNALSPFNNDVASISSVGGTITVSNIGNVGVDGRVSLADGQQQFTLRAGYKQNGETAMFYNSNSVGISGEYIRHNPETGVFYSVKGIASNTQGTIGGMQYTGPRIETGNEDGTITVDEKT